MFFVVKRNIEEIIDRRIIYILKLQVNLFGVGSSKCRGAKILLQLEPFLSFK